MYPSYIYGVPGGVNPPGSDEPLVDLGPSEREQSSENLKDDLRVNPPYMGPEGDTGTPPPIGALVIWVGWPRR